MVRGKGLVERLPCGESGGQVDGANGEQVLRETGATQAEAWFRACQFARGLGLLAQARGGVSGGRGGTAHTAIWAPGHERRGASGERSRPWRRQTNVVS